MFDVSPDVLGTEGILEVCILPVFLSWAQENWDNRIELAVCNSSKKIKVVFYFRFFNLVSLANIIFAKIF